jgi:peptide deformylase
MTAPADPGAGGLAPPELPRIVQAGDPVLRQPADAVRTDALGSSELRELVRVMVEVMRRAPGVGLAAPQIGVGLQVIVIEDKAEYQARSPAEDLAARGRTPLPLQAIVNPTLRTVGEVTATFFEGCLSVRGYAALVERSAEVEVEGFDEDGAPVRMRARGWPARILQHEVDHLRGTLYVDRMLTRSLCSNDEVDRWLGRPVAEVRAALRV